MATRKKNETCFYFLRARADARRAKQDFFFFSFQNCCTATYSSREYESIVRSGTRDALRASARGEVGVGVKWRSKALRNVRRAIGTDVLRFEDGHRTA